MQQQRQRIKSSLWTTCLALWFSIVAIWSAQAEGTWTTLNTGLPNGFSAGTMLLLTDGSVLIQQAGISNTWYKLIPNNGSYTNPTWAVDQNNNTTIASMNYTRLYYASAVLNDGRVLVAGGEYTSGSGKNVEIYDPVHNTWTEVSRPKKADGTEWDTIKDAPCSVLSDGKFLLGSKNDNNVALYDPATDTWTSKATKLNTRSSEESWAILPDQSILTVHCYGNANSNYPSNSAAKYLPSQNTWVSAGTPVSLVQYVSQEPTYEIGPFVLLPSGKCFCVGATGNTALYTPPANPADAGSWSQGPTFPTVVVGGTNKQLGAIDAPACLEPNGKVLCTVGPTTSNGYAYPTYFYEYDPVAQTLTRITAPGGGSSYADDTYDGRMLLLPTGQILFSSQVSSALYIYTPDGAPNAAWKPSINYITTNADGSYRLTGTQLNGLSEATAYGDDASAATNYPLVRFHNTQNNKVWYARTYNRSTTSVATGNLTMTTNFTLPANLDGGPFELTVITNGISSDSHAFIPYTAVGIATGADGYTRLLLASSDGRAMIWTVHSDGTHSDSPVYGPYAGWMATGISVGTDNKPWVLWDKTDGTADLWIVNSDWTYTSSPWFGPYPGWTAKSFSVGPDDKPRVLWNTTDGQADLWIVNSDWTFSSSPHYGPFTGYTATVVAMGADSKPRVMWNKNDGSMSLWIVNSDWTYTSSPQFGPYPDWTATAMAVGSDNKPRVLWSTTDGKANLWIVNSDWTFSNSPWYGPYPNWMATAISVGPDSKPWVLWDKTDGTADLGSS
ncbi:MAG TPA: kelch repeat-containing protein, partial [Chthonomonadaceae bacterium]|nr:kelch repeat-containing protein [Chthonomonadaceae bacterium]